MKHILTLILVFIGQLSCANMASPLQEGSWTATPFISKYVEIVKETILIKPDKKFDTAWFEIEYHIDVKKAGVQIPFLFYASEFRENFTLLMDGKEIQLSPQPRSYKKLEGTELRDFSSLFETEIWNGTSDLRVGEPESQAFYISMRDLKFFKVNLTKGNHIIRVVYRADKWFDQSDWIKEYSFRYALFPAKYWNSFGSLEVTLDASQFDGKLTTNLGEPNSGNLQSKCVWTFTSVPTDVFQLTYKPPMNPKAKRLLAISPIGLTLIMSLLLILLHIFAIIAARRLSPQRRYSWTVIIGSIIVPFLALFSYQYAFDIIDAAIGEHASQYHGYTFFTLLLYPIALPIYWSMMWFLDKGIEKRKVKSQ